MCSVLTRLRDVGEIRLAVEFKDPYVTGFPPEMYLDPSTGAPNGVGPILFDLIARDLAVRPKYVDLPWPDHIDALLSGDVDVILATNTPQRGATVSFIAGRLMANRVVCLVPAASTLELSAIDRPGVRIACWRGSSVANVARIRFPSATVIEDEQPEQLVLRGKADAYVNDAITKRFLELHPDLVILSNSILSREYVHFAVRHEDNDLRRWIDNWYDYHDAQGTIAAWCTDWWESHMAV